MVLRAQLPEENSFFEPNDEDIADMDEVPEEDEDSATYQYRLQHSAPTCDACGQFGNKKCGNCKTARYCHSAHQQLHWKRGGHSKQCAEIKTASTASSSASGGDTKWNDETNPFLFNEFEIITENESDVKAVRNAQVEEKQKALLDQYYEELAAEKESGEVDTTEFNDEDMPKNQHDEEFIKFQTTIDVDGTQVLRYTTSTDSKPLWMIAKGKIELSDVPKCALCGAERIFELQILPQIIYHLDVKRNHTSGNPEDEVDFGPLFIYTCKNSCEVNPQQEHAYSSGAYAIEYLYQQKVEE